MSTTPTRRSGSGIGSKWLAQKMKVPVGERHVPVRHCPRTTCLGYQWNSIRTIWQRRQYGGAWPCDSKNWMLKFILVEQIKLERSSVQADYTIRHALSLVPLVISLYLRWRQVGTLTVAPHTSLFIKEEGNIIIIIIIIACAAWACELFCHSLRIHCRPVLVERSCDQETQ